MGRKVDWTSTSTASTSVDAHYYLSPSISYHFLILQV